jgi:hypothetical protein
MFGWHRARRSLQSDLLLSSRWSDQKGSMHYQQFITAEARSAPCAITHIPRRISGAQVVKKGATWNSA